jgi:hypothetical protein
LILVCPRQWRLGRKIEPHLEKIVFKIGPIYILRYPSLGYPKHLFPSIYFYFQKFNDDVVLDIERALHSSRMHGITSLTFKSILGRFRRIIC